MIPCLLLTRAHGLHLGLLPLLGALVGGDVALALPNTIPIFLGR
jgi:hypothetical protein